MLRGGAFLKHLPGADWCEITKGRNFFEYKNKVDWIVTNPPFSVLTNFLIRSMKLSDNIVFLINFAAMFTTKRVRELKYHNFGIVEVLYVKQPETFVQCGRQLAAVYLKKDYTGECKFSYAENFDKPYRKAKTLDPVSSTG